MCGIIGIVANNAKIYEPSIDKMICALRHRGPDGSGSIYFNDCAIGHTRLSIIDIETGQQPMRSKQSKAAITFNGEIYGYKDIKANIKDYIFQTESDTEVILALYDRYGIEMLPKLPGMFSFAIWDDDQHMLFCARDRFGEKPFYFSFGKNNEFVFASEIKGILASDLVDPILDLNQIGHFLKFKYVYPNKSIYKNIYILPPAHYLTFRNGHCNIERYWSLPRTNLKISFNDALVEFERLFKKSVRQQLISDVPLSLFLSGGLDSSSIAIAAAEFKSRLKTISFGFKNDDKNELKYAKEIADLYDTDHIEIIDDNFKLAPVFIEMQTVYDEPFSDSSNIPTYLICQKAKEYTKVALGGDGGDELLAGYREYRELYNYLKEKDRTYFYFLYLWANRYLLRIIGAKRKMKILQKQIGLIRQWHNGMRIEKALENKRSYYTDNMLMEKGLNISEKIGNQYKHYNRNNIDDALRIDLQNYLCGDILVKTDRASMANSLEIRAPFLDHELSEFIVSLPVEYKINEHYEKYILRKIFNNRWPERIANRPKQGFGPPLKKWMKLSEFKELVEVYLKNPKMRIFQILEYNKVQEEIIKNERFTYNYLVLSAWMESHNFRIED